MRRAFTIVELLVAMGLFGMLLAASGVIFATAVDAHRTAEATAEITRNLAAITDQLNADFRGLRKEPPFDCPIAIWFELDQDNPDLRHDQILFFADGDFQSYRYNPPLIGNTARVYYGQANIMDVDFTGGIRNLEEGGGYEEVNILSRRQHIYHSFDPCLPAFPVTDPSNWQNTFDIDPCDNDYYEHDNISLSQWKVVTHNQNYNNQLIGTCFDNDPCQPGRPGIDLDNAETLHMLMAQGVGHFKIQWAYFWGGQLQWWPSTDPDGDPCTIDDSDFGPQGMNQFEFGIYFNMPADVDVPPGATNWFISRLARTREWFFPFGFFPEA